jgi:hypothetical protein
MGAARKIIIEVPEELLDEAQKTTGTDVAETVRRGLELVVASDPYQQLLNWRGKVQLKETSEELKADRW